MQIGDNAYRFITLNNSIPYLCKYFIVKINPKSYWVNDINCHDSLSKICYLNARKRYAYTTIEEAFDSFIARQEKRIIHINNEKKLVENALEYKGDLDRLLKDLKNDYMLFE